ncbi:MAG: hypothetical protein EZS28_016694 [Streblomastix strix]|uniref:Uncharacterized protein n=1 Tax=Streblomastix strix TaxID=222440 RepID=A0A5J4VZV8_9EUKA|nr:MAG: hypothetical protein EZS28_016694 [Streblomastix strix]
MSDTDGEKVDEVKSDPEIHEEAGEAKQTSSKAGMAGFFSSFWNKTVDITNKTTQKLKEYDESHHVVAKTGAFLGKTRDIVVDFSSAQTAKLKESGIIDKTDQLMQKAMENKYVQASVEGSKQGYSYLKTGAQAVAQYSTQMINKFQNRSSPENQDQDKLEKEKEEDQTKETGGTEDEKKEEQEEVKTDIVLSSNSAFSPAQTVKEDSPLFQAEQQSDKSIEGDNVNIGESEGDSKDDQTEGNNVQEETKKEDE